MNINNMAFDFNSFGKDTGTTETPPVVSSSSPTPTKTQGFDFKSFGTVTSPAIQQKPKGVIDTITSPVIPTTGKEDLLSGAGATIANLPTSAANFAKGILDVFNVYKTGRNFIDSGKAAIELGKAHVPVLDIIKEVPQHVYEALIPEAARKILSGDIEGARASVQNDPVGSIAPFLLAGRAAAAKAGYGTQFDNAISTIAKPVTVPVEATANLIKTATNATTKFGVSQITGLSPETISEITANPENFTKEAQASISRKGIADQIETNLQTKIADLEETGKGYGGVRNLTTIDTAEAPGSTKVINEGGRQIAFNLVDAPNEKLSVPELRTKLNLLKSDPTAPPELVAETSKFLADKSIAEPVPFQVKVSPNWLDKTIKETTGLEIKDGKLVASGDSSIRLPGDVSSLQNKIYNLWKPVFQKGYLTADEYLNFRTDMRSLAYNDSGIGKSGPLSNLSDIIAGKFNGAFRDKVPGLSELDSNFSTQINELKDLRKGLIDKDGNLTESTINKIANATGKGKDLTLAKLEEIQPGITEKIRQLKAIEDIQAAGGNKVGTYLRAGAGVTGIVTMNPYLIAGTILGIPSIAVPLLRGIGMSGEKIGSTLKLLGIPFKMVNGSPEVIVSGLISDKSKTTAQ